MSDTDTKALVERLQALEAENERLKKAKVSTAAKLEVAETEYKGNPMLEFRRANARPFSMGVKKLEAIREGWEQVENFLRKHDDNENQI